MSIKIESLSAEEISEHLLDYARGRLSAEDCSAIDDAAAKSPEILQELEYYKALSLAAAEDTGDGTAVPGDLGWARLLRAIDDVEHENAIPISANDNARPWRYAAMALGLVVMGQFALPFLKSAPVPTEDAIYVPVTEVKADFSVQVTFAPDALEGTIRGLLLSIDANIVAGPSAIGVYQLGFVDETARDAGFATLTEAIGIVETTAAQ